MITSGLGKEVVIVRQDKRICARWPAGNTEKDLIVTARPLPQNFASMQALHDDLKHWLQAFSKAVRDRDFSSGKQLFHEQVVSFGTLCSRVEGLGELAAQQWQAAWSRTRDFDFEYPTAFGRIDANHAFVAVNWHSTGLTTDGSAFQRAGRATIVLQKKASGWKAVHTHFSLKPVHENDPLFCEMP
jgi:ketosteroid isomerase-like protein